MTDDGPPPVNGTGTPGSGDADDADDGDVAPPRSEGGDTADADVPDSRADDVGGTDRVRAVDASDEESDVGGESPANARDRTTGSGADEGAGPEGDGEEADTADGADPEDTPAFADVTADFDGGEAAAPPGTEWRGPTGVAADDPGDDSLLDRFLGAETGAMLFLREVLTSVLAVTLVGLLLFAISGVWPPMVAVESGSMEPHMHKGDLVFVTEPGRFAPTEGFRDTGVVPAQGAVATEYRTFGDYGSVVVYDNPGRSGSPIIHRARFWVEEGENWYGRADPEYTSASSCADLRNCPAPHAGFITKGDANSRYDQANGISEPVKPAWITGVARVRIPLLGWIRLSLSTVDGTTLHAPVGGTALHEPVGGTALHEPVGGTALHVPGDIALPAAVAADPSPASGGPTSRRGDVRTAGIV